MFRSSFLCSICFLPSQFKVNIFLWDVLFRGAHRLLDSLQLLKYMGGRAVVDPVGTRRAVCALGYLPGFPIVRVTGPLRLRG